MSLIPALQVVLRARRKRRKISNSQKVLVHNKEMKQNFPAEAEYAFCLLRNASCGSFLDKEKKTIVCVGVGERTLASVCIELPVPRDAGSVHQLVGSVTMSETQRRTAGESCSVEVEKVE